MLMPAVAHEDVYINTAQTLSYNLEKHMCVHIWVFVRFMS